MEAARQQARRRLPRCERGPGKSVYHATLSCSTLQLQKGGVNPLYLPRLGLCSFHASPTSLRAFAQTAPSTLPRTTLPLGKDHDPHDLTEASSRHALTVYRSPLQSELILQCFSWATRCGIDMQYLTYLGFHFSPQKGEFYKGRRLREDPSRKPRGTFYWFC